MDKEVVDLVRAISLENKADLKDQLDRNRKDLRILVRTEIDMLDTRLISIDQHNAKQNGCIKDLQTEAVQCRDHRLKIAWVTKNWKGILVVVLVGMYLFHSMLEVISIPQIISFFIN